MVAFADRSMGFEPMKPHQTLMHDIFSLAVTLGGIMLMTISHVQKPEGEEVISYDGLDTGEVHIRRLTMAWLGMGLLAVIM
jgi:hypothetical protein